MRTGLWVYKREVSDPPYAKQHEYVIGYKGVEGKLVEESLGFQRGNVTEMDFSGLTNAALLAVIVDRLEVSQAGPCACDDEAIALRCLKHGLNVLTRDSNRWQQPLRVVVVDEGDL